MRVVTLRFSVISAALLLVVANTYGFATAVASALGLVALYACYRVVEEARAEERALRASGGSPEGLRDTTEPLRTVRQSTGTGPEPETNRTSRVRPDTSEVRAVRNGAEIDVNYWKSVLLWSVVMLPVATWLFFNPGFIIVGGILYSTWFFTTRFIADERRQRQAHEASRGVVQPAPVRKVDPYAAAFEKIVNEEDWDNKKR